MPRRFAQWVSQRVCLIQQRAGGGMVEEEEEAEEEEEEVEEEEEEGLRRQVMRAKTKVFALH